MQFRDYQNLLVGFVKQKMMNELILARRRYLRKEKKFVNMCTLYEIVDKDKGISRIELLVGADDLQYEEFLPFEQTIENDDIFYAMKLLSLKEKKVVSLLFKEECPFKEICNKLGTSRLKTPYEVYYRALKKMKNNINDGKGEKNDEK